MILVYFNLKISTQHGYAIDMQTVFISTNRLSLSIETPCHMRSDVLNALIRFIPVPVIHAVNTQELSNISCNGLRTKEYRDNR